MNRSECGSKSIIAPKGELDLSNVWRMRSAVEEVIASGTNDVVVDLSGVHFIDSAAIQEVVRVWRIVGRLDRDFAVKVTPGSQPQKILDMLLFDSGLHIDHAA